MTNEERALIKDLEKCDFGEIHAMHKAKVEARRNMTKEEKLVCLCISTVTKFTVLPFHVSSIIKPSLFFTS